jgi:MSHA biogenesis protein MshK
MSRALLVCVLYGIAGAALAQAATLSDPTRPPNVASETAGEATMPVGPKLQSILISPARRVAVISGREVTEGGKFGEATIASITESTVTLKYADRRETLHLLPGVEKRQRRAADAATPDKGTAR